MEKWEGGGKTEEAMGKLPPFSLFLSLHLSVSLWIPLGIRLMKSHEAFSQSAPRSCVQGQRLLLLFLTEHTSTLSVSLSPPYQHSVCLSITSILAPCLSLYHLHTSTLSVSLLPPYQHPVCLSITSILELGRAHVCTPVTNIDLV